MQISPVFKTVSDDASVAVVLAMVGTTLFVHEPASRASPVSCFGKNPKPGYVDEYLSYSCEK